MYGPRACAGFTWPRTGETLFIMLRPVAASQDASPAPLRLTLRPLHAGIEIGFLKRRGPQRDEPLILPLAGPANIGIRRADNTERHRKVSPEVVVPARSLEDELEENGP